MLQTEAAGETLCSHTVKHAKEAILMGRRLRHLQNSAATLQLIRRTSKLRQIGAKGLASEKIVYQIWDIHAKLFKSANIEL